VRTRVKICGVRDAATAIAAAEAGADAIGLVFAEGSPRRVSREAAAAAASATPAFVSVIGLFVDATPAEVAEARDECRLHAAQLHGSEDEATAEACGPGAIKAIRYDASTIEAELRRWSAARGVAALLVDGSAGGMGEAFDWAGLAAAREACGKPIILAGGLTPETVGEAIRVARPFAVDVSSGVESSRGVKDVALIRAFCDAVRDADG